MSKMNKIMQLEKIKYRYMLFIRDSLIIKKKKTHKYWK